jgi:uncharacterized phage-associated protein
MAARLGSVCKYICETGGWQVSNLQLQKILYLTQMIYIGRHGERLVDAAFEAWDYGPVEPTAYRRVRMFGSAPIQNVFFDARDFKETDVRRDFLDTTCADLLPLKASDLVEITHWHRGAWAQHYEPGTRGIKIPDADIAAEYTARLGSGQFQ